MLTESSVEHNIWDIVVKTVQSLPLSIYDLTIWCDWGEWCHLHATRLGWSALAAACAKFDALERITVRYGSDEYFEDGKGHIASNLQEFDRRGVLTLMPSRVDIYDRE